jgi:hypothetical protein
MDALHVRELPESAGNQFLYCDECGGEYSATRGDYFWMSPSETLECHSPEHVHAQPLRLVVRHSTLEVIA